VAREATDVADLLDALAPAQMSLQTELRTIADDDWFRPTPARRWAVRDQIAHLADIDEVVKYCDARTASGSPALPHPAEVKLSMRRTGIRRP